VPGGFNSKQWTDGLRNGFGRKLQVYEYQMKEDRIKDDLIGEESSVTPLELSPFRVHEISLHDDVRWRWNKVHQSQASTIATPMTTRHMSLKYIITTLLRVLS